MKLKHNNLYKNNGLLCLYWHDTLLFVSHDILIIMIISFYDMFLSYLTQYIHYLHYFTLHYYFAIIIIIIVVIVFYTIILIISIAVVSLTYCYSFKEFQQIPFISLSKKYNYFATQFIAKKYKFLAKNI